MIQLWPHDDLGELDRKRAALDDDADWKSYLQNSTDVIVEQRARVGRRVSFPATDTMSAAVHNKPIVDLRTYAIRRTRVKDFLNATEQYCLPVQLRHIGPPLAYYVTQIGELDQVTHLWGYDSLADLEQRRAARNRDPDWATCLEASDGLFVNQENWVVRRLQSSFCSPTRHRRLRGWTGSSMRA